MNIEIKTSNKPNKKCLAVINNKKTLHFGDSRYEDFTTHKDPTRKISYLSRQMIILQTLYILHFIQLICCGVNQH